MNTPKVKTPIELHVKETREAGVLATKHGTTISISAEGRMDDVLSCFANTAFYIANRLEHEFQHPVSAYEALAISLNLNTPAKASSATSIIQ